MSDIKVQDYNTVASSVLLAALGAAGTPALLSADNPAGAIAQKFHYAGGQISAIEFYSDYDPATQNGTLLGIHQFT